MNQPKRIFLIAVFFAFSLFGLSETIAQTTSVKQSEPSFDVLLQTVTASNVPTEKSDLPQSLSGVAKKLKSDFSFSKYQLTSTFIQRISNKGNTEFKTVAYENSQNRKIPIFSEWTINGLQNLLDDGGKDIIKVDNFRYGQQIPIQNSNNTISYERIGLTTAFTLMKNTPTVIGTLTTSNPNELIFLILTVKSTEK